MNTKPTKEELRDMLEKGMSLYQISRMYKTTIPAIFQLEKDYDIIPKTFILKKCYHISKEDLESMYINERMSQRQIAEELGCSTMPVRNLMNYYHIPTRGCGRFTPQQRSLIYDKIEQEYKDGKTQEEIAKEVGYSSGNVGIILKERGVQTRLSGKYTPQQRQLLYDEIVQRYNNGETEEEIAKKVGYTTRNVSIILRERGIPTRQGGKYTPQQRDSKADEIVQRYNNGETEEEIAEKVGYDQGHVGRILRERGVQIRVSNGTITHHEMSLITADKIQECIDKDMDQHQIAQHFGVCDATIFNMAKKFGVTGMVNNFRCLTPEYIDWRDEVLIRDNYTCQLCGSPENPEVHHIYKYSDYPDRQFDVDNGIVLCHWCHQKVTGHESEYIVELEDIVLRDRGIGD